MLRYLLTIALACLVNMTLVLTARAAPTVWVAMTDAGGVYAEAATVLQNQLQEKATVEAGSVVTVLSPRQMPPDLIVTVGTEAFDKTLTWLGARDPRWARVPVLAILLPRAAYEARLAGGGPSRPVSAVVLDQPLSRQLALITLVAPDRKTIGVLPGAQTQPLLPTLERAAQARGLRVKPTRPVADTQGIYPALKEALESADVLLALPDPVIYNSATLKNILLASYRARVPLVAFSAAYVKAGALAAVFATPSQVGDHAADVVDAVLAGRSLPAVQAPHDFTVAVNDSVAASLGLRLDTPAQIRENLRRMERQP